MDKPLLGVLGGMGALATACFYEKLHSLQGVSTEQEYLDILLYSKPSIPDRTAFITGQSTDSPLDSLIHAARVLETAGAACIAIPCVTAHFFYAGISDAVSIPVLNLPDETARFASEHGIKKIGLLATDGTIEGKVFHSPLEGQGIDMIIPQADAQSGLMSMIYDIKRGSEHTAGTTPELLDSIAAELRSAGAQAVILGCTDLCVIACSHPETINCLDILAKASLRVVERKERKG
jgi:aspartate racemase